MNAKELDKIRKSLEAAVKDKNRENIIIGLAELEELIEMPRYGFRDEAFEVQEMVSHDLFELGMCKDIEELDELFKEVESLKKKKEKLTKPTKEERARKKFVTNAKELEEKGLDPDIAKEVAAERLMEQRGFKKCVRCHEWIDTKHGMGIMALVMDAGKPYHKHCIDERDAEMEEVLAGIPMMREGQEIVCTYCNEPIMARDPFKWVCPEGESFLESSLCKYYHAFAEPHPLSCWWKYRKDIKRAK